MAKKSFDELYKEAKSKKSFDELYKEAPENTARRPQSSAQPSSFNNVNPSNNALGAIRDAQNKLSTGSRNTSAFDVAPKPITLNAEVEAYRKQTFDNYQVQQRKQAEEREEIRNKYTNLDQSTLTDIEIVAAGKEAEDYTKGLTGFIGRMGDPSIYAKHEERIDIGEQASNRLKAQGYTQSEIDAWAEMLRDKENIEFRENVESQSAKLAEEHPVLGSAASVFLRVASAPASAVAIIDDVAQDGRIDTNDKLHSLNYSANKIRSTVSENIAKESKAGAWFYNVGMSGADSIVASTIPGGAAILATSAAVDTTIDLTERGVDSNKALVGGIAAGAFEAIFESISIGRFKALQKVSPKGVKDIVRNLANSMGVNASEETLTEAANIVYDTIAHGDLSNYNLMVENLKSQGMTETQAKKEAVKALVGQVFEAGAAGAVMGGAFTAIGTPIGYARNASTAKVIGTQINNAGEADAIIAEGLAAPKGTAPYLAAQQAKKKSEKGKSFDRALGVTAMEVGNYISENTFETKGRFAKATTIDEVGEIYESQKRMYEEASMTPAQRKKALKQLEAEHREAVDNLYYSGISGVAEMREAGKAATTSPEAIVKTKMPTIGRDEDGDAVSVSEITDISDGVITVKTSDGGSQELDIKDVKGINAQELWTSAAEMFTDASSAQAFIDNYNGGSVHEYSKAFSDYYHLAATGMSLEQIQETDFLRVGELSETAQIAAVEAGKKAMSFKMGVVDLTTRAKTKAENLQMNILNNVGNHIGMNIIVVDTLEGYEGFQKVGSNQIVVSLDSSKGVIVRTGSHETYHFVKQELGDSVQKISDFVIDTLTENKGEAFVKERLEFYKSQGYETEAEQIDELVADSLFDAFSNERAVKQFASENASLAEKIGNHIRKLVADIKNIIKKLVATGKYQEIQAWQEDLESLDKLNNMFLDALDELAERNAKRESTQIVEENGYIVDETGAIRPSIRHDTDMEGEVSSEELAKRMSEVNGLSYNENLKFIRDTRSISSRYFTDVFEGEGYLDYEADEDYDVIKSNSDYSQGSIDFNTNCPKRRDFTEIYDALQKKYPNHTFTAYELAYLRQIIAEEGLEVACGCCFVEDRRVKLGEIAEEYVRMYNEAIKSESGQLIKRGTKGKEIPMFVTKTIEDAFGDVLGVKQGEPLIITDKYELTQYDIGTYDGFSKLKKNHPQIAMGYIAYNNSRGQQAGRLIEGVAEYKRQLLDWSQQRVDRANSVGGLRIFSFSDFVAVHALDMIQIIQDASAIGLKVQGYTKINAFARMVKDTGIKLNRSLIPTDTGIKVVDGKKVLAFNTRDGIDPNSKDFFDSTDNPNVGNILIGISEEQIRLAMESDLVDYIIPFHSNQARRLLEWKNVPRSWKNYKSVQLEKDARTKKVTKDSVNIYTDVIDKYGVQTEREFVERFLQECKERNLIPRFSEFLNQDSNGDYVYTEGYYKLLLDFKLFDKNGNILPQNIVQPIFETDFINEMLDDYVKGETARKGAGTKRDAVVEKFSQKLDSGELKQIVAQSVIDYRAKKSVMPTVFADPLYQTIKRASTKRDADYMTAVENGDMETAQRMVDEVAKSAGYTVKAYHGTSYGGFTVFDTYGGKFGLFGKGSYFTEDKNVADSYQQKGKGNNKQTYSVYLSPQKALDMDANANVAMWQKAVPDAADYFENCKTNEDCFKQLKEYCADYEMRRWEAEDLITDVISYNMGYDAITHIGGGRFNRQDATRHRVYIVFEPVNIKSADPVTYDNNGNVIPLSERFNEKEVDIRYSRKRTVASGKKKSYNKHTTYNQFNSVAMNWSRQADRMIGDLAIFAYDYDDFRLIEATENGYVELARGKYKNVRSIYERAYRNSTDTLYGHLKEFRAEKRRNIRNLQPYENRRYDDRGSGQVGREELQSDSTGSNEYSRLGDKEKLIKSIARESSISEEASDYILDTKEYREILDIVDERFELAGRKELSPKAIDRLAGRLLDKSNSKYDRELLTERLTALFDYIANSRDVGWEDVTSIAAEISKDILKQSQTLDRSMQTEFADVLKLMKESKVFISPELKAEIAYNFGSYEAFRKMLGNKLKVTVTDSSAVPLDVFWRELSEARPDMFDSGVNYLDMPQRIADFIEMTQPQYINPYNIEMDMDEAAFDFALQMYEEYFSIPEVISESKKHSREVERLKGRYNAKIRDIHSTYRERISRIRKEKNNKIEATKELYRQRHEAYREKRNESQAKQNLRKSIYKISKAIIDKLVRPTDAKYIPQELVAPITEFAKIITEGGTFSFKQTQRLIDALQVIEKKNLGESLESIADETVIADLQELRDLLDGRAMVNLTSSELKKVRDITKSFRHLIYTTNKMHSDNIRETVSEIGQSFLAEMKDKKTGSKRFSTEFQRGLIKPVTFFDMLESPTMQRVYQNLRNGESDWYRTASEIKEKIASLQEKYGYSRWKNKPIKIELERDGKTIVFTMEEALSIYATAKREQGLMHLLANGFVRQEEEYAKLLKVLKKEYKKDSSMETPKKLLESMKGKATTLTINDIKAITEAIDAEARQYADDFVAYMSKDMADLGNQTALKLKGRKIFGEDYYFPIVSDPNHLHFAAAKGVDARLKNMSMTKATVEKAKNSIVIGGFTDTAAKHCLDMAMYSAFTLPLEDFTRVLNYGVDATVESDALSVRQEIERVYGAGAVNYIKTLLSDINGGVVVRGAGALNKLISMTKKDAVIGSLSVAIQQPSAIGRAFAYINPRFFFARGSKNSWEELKKYAPVAGVKEMGYFDTNIGRTALEWVTDGTTASSVTAIDKIARARDWSVDKLSTLPAKMDEITWSRIWAAVKAETHHKHPEMDVKSEEFLKLAGERFTYVIDRTQVYDSVFARSEWMRAKDSGVKQMMAFMNEPLVSLNMLYEASVMKQDSKGAKAKFVMKTLTSVLFASALNSALKSIVQTMRDDDDDESALEQYLSKLVENFVYEPLGWIPIFGDVLDGIRTGFDSQNMSESALSTILDSFVGIFKEDKSDYEKIKAICGAVGLIAGVPVKNVWREFEAVKNAIKSSALGIENVWGDESGVAEALSKLSWLYDEDDIKVLEEGRGKTTEKGIGYGIANALEWKGLPWVKEVKQPEQAVMAFIDGDGEHVDKILGNLRRKYDGDMKQVNSQLRTVIKEKYLGGEISRSEAEKAMSNLVGDDDDTVYWRLKEWDNPSEEFSKYGSFYDAIESGSGIQSAVDELLNHGADKKELSSRITSEFKPRYVELYNSDPTSAKELRKKLLDAYEILGYDRDDKYDDIADWVKDK